MIGRHVSDFIKDASKVDEISTALNTTGKWEGEFFALKKDGSSFIAWGQKTAVMDEDGNQIGYQSGVIDITSRKMVEEALIQSEAIQNILLNATTDTIAMIEKNGIINIINDIGAQRFGKVAGEMVGLNLFDFFPKDLLAFRKTKINSVFETGKPILFEDSRNNLNFETSVYPILNNDGEVSHVGIFATDITESKIIQEALSESEEQHRKIFESVTDAIFICDMTGGIVEVNPAASIIYGYSREEFLTMGPADLVHPDYGNELQRFFMEATAGDVFHGETVDIRKDGTYINSEVIGTTLVFQGEKHLMAIIRNITEIKKAREEVDRFFNVTSNLLCIAGVDGYFRQLNPAWEKLLGYSREELLSVPFIGFTHPDDIEPTLKEMEKLLKGAVTINFMNRWRCKDGSYKWLNWNTTSFEDTLYAAAVDITKIKKTEAEMKMLLAELERSNKELEQFAYIASHDLQEPLRMVSSFLQLLNKRYADKLGEEGHEFIHFAVDGANRMKQLIVDLLTFSRVGTKGKDFLPVNMNELLDKVKRNLQNMIKETGAVITSDNLPVIEADESQMMQLFQNLLDNAIKFRGKQKPSIRISIENHRGMFEFSISDNGIGIEERFAERIFVIFQRLHTRDEYPGTGIGLAVCKKIALRHQGDIYMVSRPGEGSIFKFTIAKNLKRLNK
nr:PAS domain S-box protein [Bacteroidota bacterium]